MNDELSGEPESKKPESQIFCNKSVSAGLLDKNQQLDRTSLTPTKSPDKNIPYILTRNVLNPISDDIVASGTSVGTVNVPSPTANTEAPYINTRAGAGNNLPPLKRIPKAKDMPVGEKKYRVIISTIIGLIITIIGLLILILIPSSSGFIKNLASFSPQKNLYQDIGAKCPAIKNNIKKVEIDPSSDRNLIVTKTGDLYIFIGINNMESSEYKAGDCYKSDKISNLNDAVTSESYTSFQQKDGTLTYGDFYSEKTYYRLFILGENTFGNFPLLYPKNATNIKKLDINRYFYQSDHEKTFFIDTKNNIYDDNFNKLIDGLIFDSEITPVSSVQEKNNVIYIGTKSFIYQFNINNKIDGTTSATLNKKTDALFGNKADDIVQVISTDDKAQTYIVTKDGKIYQSQDTKTITTTTKTSSQNQTIIILLFGLYLIGLLLIIVLSYNGELKSYASGLQKILILIVTVCVIMAIYGFTTNSPDNITALNVLSAVISGFIYFTSYFITKRIIWFIMHKANVRSKVIFGVMYILLYIVFAEISIWLNLIYISNLLIKL